MCTSKPSPDRSIRVSNPQSEQAAEKAAAAGERQDASSAEESLTSDDQRRRERTELENVKKSPFFPFYSPSSAHYFLSKKSPARSPSPNAPSAGGNSTPKRFFKRPFPPPSPAKHIRVVLARRHGSVKPNEATIPEGSEAEGMVGLDKSFEFSKHFGNKYELGDEVGRGHFGYTCAAKFKKGELKGQQVAVKVIPKVKV